MTVVRQDRIPIGGCAGTEGTNSSVPKRAGRWYRHTTRHVLLVLLLLLAFSLRVHLLPSVPFGWHPDEATKALLARDVLAGKSRPVFFSAFTGRDALYVYLEALAFAALGESMFAGRLLSAFIGMLTVAAAYALSRALFGHRVGLLTGALLAASLWHLIASRNAYRAVLQPLVQLPALWLLFRGWRVAPESGRWSHLVAGVFVGLTQYTYTAARAFPVLVVLIVLAALVSAPRLVARRWLSLVLMILAAVLVVFPLATHFLQHPGDFAQRAIQISVLNPAWAGEDPWGRFWQSAKETARMFSVWGDPNYRFNVAGRPVFGVADGVLFYGGFIWCLWLALREKGLRRVTYAMLLLWLGIMLIPMTLSAEGLPYYQRAIGILPAVYILPALCLDRIVAWAERVVAWSRHRTGMLSAGFLALIVICLTVRTCKDYFIDWDTATRNDDDRRVAMVYVADYLTREASAGELYLSTEYAEHPTLAFLAPERYDGIHWFDAQQSLPLPPPDVEATYVFLLENPPQPNLALLAPGLRPVHTGFDRFGRPVFEAYRWTDGAYPVPADRSPAVWSWEVRFELGDPQGLRHAIDLPVNFGDVMAFVGHDRSAETVGPGEQLELILYWRLLQRPARHYSIFAHLLDADSDIVGEYDGNRYGTKFWREEGGELLLSYFPLRVRPDTPPGEYQLEIGVYHQPTDDRLPITDHEGERVADRLLLSPVAVR